MQEDDVDMVMCHVVGIVESYVKRSEKAGSSRKPGLGTRELDWRAAISDAVRPFIFELANRFSDELDKFLASGLDIAAYDALIYGKITVPKILNLSSTADDQGPSRVLHANAYDLYDEDVDEGGPLTVVERLNREGGSHQSAEDLVNMEPENNTTDMDGERGRSRQRRKLSKKRKISSSSTSRSRSPTKHKHKHSKKHRSSKTHGGRQKRTLKKEKAGYRERKHKIVKTHKRRVASSSSSGSSSDSDHVRRHRRNRIRAKESKNKVQKGYSTKTNKSTPVAEKTPVKRKTIDEKLKEKELYERQENKRNKSEDFDLRAAGLGTYENAEALTHYSPAQVATRPKSVAEGAFGKEKKTLVPSDVPSSATLSLPTSSSGEANKHEYVPSNAGIESVAAESSLGDGTIPKSPSPTGLSYGVANRQVECCGLFEESCRENSLAHDAQLLEIRLRQQALANLMRHLTSKKEAAMTEEIDGDARNPKGTKGVIVDENLKPQGITEACTDSIRGVEEGCSEEGEIADHDGKLMVKKSECPLTGHAFGSSLIGFLNASEALQKSFPADLTKTSTDEDLAFNEDTGEVMKGGISGQKDSHTYTTIQCSQSDVANVADGKPSLDIKIKHITEDHKGDPDQQNTASVDAVAKVPDALEHLVESSVNGPSIISSGKVEPMQPKAANGEGRMLNNLVSETSTEAGVSESNSEKFQQKSMSVMRGGEAVQVSYKVYIPQRAVEAAARRRLRR